ncbi:MAG: hypothetical protein Q7J07_10070 [Pelolinea sp.]|nr:hypothetical protein [Pelolinea sp.]
MKKAYKFAETAWSEYRAPGRDVIRTAGAIDALFRSLRLRFDLYLIHNPDEDALQCKP